MVARPRFDVPAFLAEPHRPAAVAVVNRRGEPALASMWFLFEDRRMWFHTATIGPPSPYLAAAHVGATVAVMVETFDARDRVLKVRVTGPARIETTDIERVQRIYDRYLGGNVNAWSPAWDEQARSSDYQLWSVSPDRGSAVDYPRLQNGGGIYRWEDLSDFPTS